MKEIEILHFEANSEYTDSLNNPPPKGDFGLTLIGQLMMNTV